MIIKNKETSAELDALLDVFNQVPEVIKVTVSDPTDVQLLQIASNIRTYSETPTLFEFDLRFNNIDKTIQILWPKEFWSKFKTTIIPEQTILGYSIILSSFFFNDRPQDTVIFMYDWDISVLHGGYVLDPIPVSDWDPNLVLLTDSIKNDIPRIISFSAHYIVDDAVLADLEEGAIGLTAYISTNIPLAILPGGTPSTGKKRVEASVPVALSYFNDPEKYRFVTGWFQSFIDEYDASVSTGQ